MIILPSRALFGRLYQAKKHVNIKNMHDDTAELTEIYLNEKAAGRIRCAPQAIPAPGQYLLAQASHEPDIPLATPLFSAGLRPNGFAPAHPLPANWLPGTSLTIRGPFGKGFKLPATARFVLLAAFSKNPSRLLALIEPILAQNAAIVLLIDNPPDQLSPAIEISPLAALRETILWADYLAIDAPRTHLSTLLPAIAQSGYHKDGQIIVDTPIPCGGMAECGTCAIQLHKGFKLTCKEGPVFDIKTLLE